MRKYLYTHIIALCILSSFGQNGQHLNVLFIGNSYTDVNNLPATIASIAASTGDTLTHDKNTPGGCTFNQHTQNQSATKIASGGWDYVVLQEQSQYPAFPISQVEAECFPYATTLAKWVREYNTHGIPVFFMTWGHKNGDAFNCASYPPICTYKGMDSLLYERYMIMAHDNDATVSPVGRVWREIRTYYPAIELYSPDESHPSTIGTYVAACTFYTILFQKDPTLITYNNNIDANITQIIKNTVKTLVYNDLKKWNVKQIGYANAYTDSVTHITQTIAVLQGRIQSKNINVKEMGFEYKLSTDTSFNLLASKYSILKDTLYHLIPNHNYSFRAYAVLENDSVIFGEEKSFNTLAISVYTDSITHISDTTALLTAYYSYDGDTSLIQIGFLYTDSNTTFTIEAILSDSSNFYANLMHLTPNTTYQVKAYCVYNLQDTSFGMFQSFTTTQTIEEEDTTYISTISITQTPTIYPNPTKDIVYIKTPNNQIYTILFYNVYGQLLQHIKSKKDTESFIELHNISSGIYYIQLIEENNYQQTFKIIKQ